MEYKRINELNWIDEKIKYYIKYIEIYRKKIEY